MGQWMGIPLANAEWVLGANETDLAHHSDPFLLLHCPLWGHAVNFHFVANDAVMVFFFGLAAKEITEAFPPGGSLNPPSKSVNPLICTLGGVFGPIVTYMILVQLFMAAGMFEDKCSFSDLQSSWGIVTAADISLGWLVALVIFGHRHPAVDFLLLLAVADDAIGMIIIAAAYPDPDNPVEPIWMVRVLLGMLIAFLMRKYHFHMKEVTRRNSHQSWVQYIVLPGLLSWLGFLWLMGSFTSSTCPCTYHPIHART
jgi:NhaA family Na+:H+ antiporter